MSRFVHRYQARVIIHSEAPQYRPGLLTALAAGVFVGRTLALADLNRDALGLLGIAATDTVDLAAGYVPRTTKTEVVLITTIEKNNRFILRRSDIYYVPDGDANLFSRKVAQNTIYPFSRGENVGASAEEKEEAERLARYELFIGKMRHTNPTWQPEPSDSLLFN